MEKFEIIFYKTENKYSPVKEFLDSLDKKMRSKMLLSIKALQTIGTQTREPYSKAIGDGIFELRAKSGSDISRVLYFFVIGNKAVLTNGFVKKTQKTPHSEIELAKKRREDYLRSLKKEGE